MKINVQIRALHPRRVFRISRAKRTEVRNVFLSLEQDGVTGWGEASPNSYYQEDADQVAEKLRGLSGRLRGVRIGGVEDIARMWENFWPLLAPSRAAQCALDLALWDWLGKKEGVSVSELVWGWKPKALRSFGTLGITDAAERSEALRDYAGFEFLKLKMGAEPDGDLMEEVRRGRWKHWSVDANASWLPAAAGAWARRLAEAGADFLEQPFPAAAAEQSAWLKRQGILPVYADESCVVEEDVRGLEGVFSGGNIKLVKCGGLTPGLRMRAMAKELGLGTMVGCMLESSLLIAAGAVLAQGTDYADLDGAWLLGDDPFRGAPMDRGRLQVSAAPGFGVSADLS